MKKQTRNESKVMLTTDQGLFNRDNEVFIVPFIEPISHDIWVLLTLHHVGPQHAPHSNITLF